MPKHLGDHLHRSEGLVISNGPPLCQKRCPCCGARCKETRGHQDRHCCTAGHTWLSLGP